MPRTHQHSLVCLLATVTLLAAASAQAQEARWSAQQANEWYKKQPWLVGCNFIPSTAINQLEMWQEDTFDPKTIDRELGWAADLGMNSVRVYLHDLAWQADAKGFKKRMGEFLDIAKKHKIRPLFCIFDDCWNTNPQIGKQPEPTPGVHNSGWVQSPSSAVVTNPKDWERLEKYVGDILTTFGKDDRILLWDLYNEPGNTNLKEKSLPLLQKVFEWARKAKPSQPVSVGVWFDNKTLNDYQLTNSDVITFHNYNHAGDLEKQIENLKKLGRPVICTEYMARTRNSKFETCLPVFKKHNVGCFNWGLVAGKSNTIYPWNSPKNAPEPKIWFHDIFRPDGTPFDPKEVALIKKLTKG